MIRSDLSTTKKNFIDFSKSFSNCNCSTKFENDIENMNCSFCINLFIRNKVIKLYFLSESSLNGYTYSVIQAVHIFCNMFPSDYDGLTIYVCLDYNHRNVIYPSSNMPVEKIFNELKKSSAGFNVSGVTYKHQKVIYISRCEEIIKLLFHEMIHFAGLDREFLNKSYDNFGLSIKPDNLLLFETYTEFMAILLNTAYESIYISTVFNLNILDVYKKIFNMEIMYSVYLSSNILKFYGYDHNNFNNFFSGQSTRADNPILIWEYVFLRTQLLLNFTQVMEVIDNKWCLGHEKIDDVISLMKINNKFIKYIKYFMNLKSKCENISYTLIDIDWNKI